jgi:hypothetical protein
MQNYAVARGTPRGPRREGPYEEGFVSSLLTKADDKLPPMPTHVQKSLDAPTPQPYNNTSSHPSPSPGGTISQPMMNGNSGAKPPSISSEQYAVPGIPSSSGATFGVDLGEQLQRDSTEVPKVVEMCANAIEAYGTSHVREQADK